MRRNVFEIPGKKLPSLSIIIPARNEEKYIEPIIRRLPRFPVKTEIIFVEGHSRDQTREEIEEVVRRCQEPAREIICLTQTGIGKADAVWRGFRRAIGDVLVIFDADMTVLPEDLTRFYDLAVNNPGALINGSRLVYKMEEGAMRPLNYLGNKFFAMVLSLITGQKLTDTLCGTKVLYKEDFKTIEKTNLIEKLNDPFGDFTILLGAAMTGLKIIEIPIVYRRRVYGQTKIRRFKDGWKLLKIVFSFIIHGFKR